MEQSRLEQSRLEQSRLEQSRLEQSRLEQSRLEQSRLEQSRLEQSRLEQSRLEQIGRKTDIFGIPENFLSGVDKQRTIDYKGERNTTRNTIRKENRKPDHFDGGY